jgi:hypothetical protein
VLVVDVLKRMRRKNSLRMNLGQKHYALIYQVWYHHFASNDNDELNISLKNFLRVLKWATPILYKYQEKLEPIFQFTRTNNDEDIFWVGKGGMYDEE